MDGVPQLEDPSDMKKEQITRLLEYWRRPVHASELFRFSSVLVNNKTEETKTALYADSFADLYSLTPDDWNADYNALSGVDTGVPTAMPLPTRIPDPEIHPTSLINPASDSFPENLTPNQTHPTLDPNIDPALQGPALSFPSQTHPTLDPNIDPALQDPALSFPSGAPTPVIGPSTHKSFTGVPTLNRNPVHSPTHSLPSGAPTPVIGPSVDKSPDPSPRPRPRARPRKTKTKPIVSSDEPNPTSRQEDDLGRPKRVPKRKTDLYLEAEEKTELAKKKQKNRK